jgi:dTMP kinase
VLELHRIGSKGLLPDLTLLIEVSPGIAATRLEARDGEQADRIGGRAAAYHAAVAAAFVRFAEAEPARFIRIDGDGSADAVHAEILASLLPLLDGRA